MKISLDLATRHIRHVLPGSQILRTLGQGSGGIVIEVLANDNTEKAIAEFQQQQFHQQQQQQSQQQQQQQRFFQNKSSLFRRNNTNDYSFRSDKDKYKNGMRNIAVKLMRNTATTTTTEFTVSSLLMHTLAKSDYLNIPELVLVTNPFALILSDVCPFGSVSALVANNTSFSTQQLKAMTFQVCTAMTQLELCGVIHMDIKPDNVIVDSLTPFRVKLIDFDRCIVLRENQRAYVKPSDGTPLFMAPEVYATRFPSNDPLEAQVSASVWCFGMTLIDISCGFTKTIRSFNELEHFYVSMRQDPFSIMPNDVTAEWKEFWGFVCSLVQYEPTRRLSLPEILSHEWTFEGTCECCDECCDDEEEEMLSNRFNDLTTLSEERHQSDLDDDDDEESTDVEDEREREREREREEKRNNTGI